MTATILNFGDRLCDATIQKKSAIMAGIDPRFELLPEPFQSAAIEAYGPTLAAVANAYLQFGKQFIDCIAPLVPVVKFQVAFFEAAGVDGMATLKELIGYAKQAGLLVVIDGKRNDIGSTAQAYSQAWLGKSIVGDASAAAWDGDALTINPYLGSEGIDPFLADCDERGSGVFVLVRTSNPGAGRLQDLQTASGRAIYQVVADWVEEWSAARAGGSGYGPVGAVAGATVPEHLRELRERMPHSILLVPGYGAQGGTAAEVACAFDQNGLGAVINNSRGIMFAHRNPQYAGMDWTDAVVAAASQMRDDLAAHTPTGRLR